MADFVTRAQVEIKATSGIAEDSAVNVWHFHTLSLATPWTSIRDALVDFYVAVQGLFPSTVLQNGHRIRLYRLDDPEPRAPVLDEDFNLTTPTSGTALPPELAACLSFQAERVSGQDQARRRGRVYIGPLDTAMLTGGLLTAAVQSSLATAATALLTESVAQGDWDWAVYSRVNGTAEPVTNGWVDNAPDVQRRRGLAATNRVTW